MHKQSAHSLLDVINNILDFPKIEEGKMDPAIQPVDLINLTALATNINSFQAQKKSGPHGRQRKRRHRKII